MQPAYRQFPCAGGRSTSYISIALGIGVIMKSPKSWIWIVSYLCLWELIGYQYLFGELRILSTSVTARNTLLIHPLGAQLADTDQLDLFSKYNYYSLAESGTIMRPWSLMAPNWHPWAGCILSKSTCGEACQ